MANGEWLDGAIFSDGSLRPGSNPNYTNDSDCTNNPNDSDYANYSDYAGGERGGEAHR